MSPYITYLPRSLFLVLTERIAASWEENALDARIPRKAQHSVDAIVCCVAWNLLVCGDNMDLKSSLYNLRQELLCPVCSEILKDPRQLPCLHCFCLHCLQHWHQESGGQDAFRCPKCHGFSRVPASGDLKDLPPNFHLNALIDVLAIKEGNKTQVTCGNCDKKYTEASYCFHCALLWCKQCLIAHNMMRSNKDHRVLAVKEFQDRDYDDVLKRQELCQGQEYRQEEPNFFGERSETAVCQTGSNLHHGAEEQEDEIQNAELTALVQKQRDNLRAQKNLAAQLGEEYVRVVEHSENVKKEVERYANNLIRIIEAKKENIFSTVENEANKSLESVNTTKAELEQEIEVIESTIERANTILTRCSDIEVIQLANSLEAMFEGIDQTESVARDPEVPNLVFEQNQEMLDAIQNEGIGFLEYSHRILTSEPAAEEQIEDTAGREAQSN